MASTPLALLHASSVNCKAPTFVHMLAAVVIIQDLHSPRKEGVDLVPDPLRPIAITHKRTDSRGSSRPLSPAAGRPPPLHHSPPDTSSAEAHDPLPMPPVEAKPLASAMPLATGPSWPSCAGGQPPAPWLPRAASDNAPSIANTTPAAMSARRHLRHAAGISVAGGLTSSTPTRDSAPCHRWIVWSLQRQAGRCVNSS